MMATTPRASRSIRRLVVGAVVLAFAGLVFGGVDGAWPDPVTGTIRMGVRQARDRMEECWTWFKHAYEVASGSIRLLARIDRELTARPVTSAGSKGQALPGSPRRAMPTALMGSARTMPGDGRASV
jgi:hypothetical protein